MLKNDLSFINKHFGFDWKKEMQQYDVFKLTTEDHFIHGLISMQLQEGCLFLSLAEVADINFGSGKLFDRSAGNLFAFAAQTALENVDGFMYMFAKTKLIPYYESKYGFRQVGNSQRMISTDENSGDLVNLYL